jgi:hypothetical protein
MRQYCMTAQKSRFVVFAGALFGTTTKAPVATMATTTMTDVAILRIAECSARFLPTAIP